MKDVLSLVAFALGRASRRFAKRMHRGRAGAACTSLQPRRPGRLAAAMIVLEPPPFVSDSA
jgi:hypothetical protein